MQCSDNDMISCYLYIASKWKQKERRYTVSILTMRLKILTKQLYYLLIFVVLGSNGPVLLMHLKLLYDEWNSVTAVIRFCLPLWVHTVYVLFRLIQ